MFVKDSVQVSPSSHAAQATKMGSRWRVVGLFVTEKMLKHQMRPEQIEHSRDHTTKDTYNLCQSDRHGRTHQSWRSL